MESTVRFTVLTLFPSMFEVIQNEGVVARAIARNLISIKTVFLRDFSESPRKNVDDHPTGGGDGMVLRADVTARAIEAVLTPESYLVHLTPSGKIFNNQHAKFLAKQKHVILLCGRYAGFDRRVIEKYADIELSIGDFVLSGGELPAMCLIDSTCRFVPGVLGNSDSAVNDSFEDGLLEPPPYTSPTEFAGRSIPPVLLSGDHKKIAEYRRREQLRMTALYRPDLIHLLWEGLTRPEKTFVEKIWKGQIPCKP